MLKLSQSPTDPAFVQDPYRFYERARREAGALYFWTDYGMPCVVGFAAAWAILRDRRFGRQAPPGKSPQKPAHQAGFWAVEDHSMLELEPPRHTRLRGLVLRAFTSRRIAALEPQIAELANDLVDDFPEGSLDLLEHFARPIPIALICRLLGVPVAASDRLMAWSHAMVGMYQARRDHAAEVAAATAATEFSDFIRDYIAHRRRRPANDLITELIAAEQEGDRLSAEELIATCILLLNAGHEATVHAITNSIFALLRETPEPARFLTPDKVDATVEEALRFDPPLHFFHRWAYEDVEIGRHRIEKGTKLGVLLAAANRDPGRWDAPSVFDPERPAQTNVSFGAGVHFCIGAPLARLEMRTALPILFQRLPGLALAGRPRYADTYHFHGLEALEVSR